MTVTDRRAIPDFAAQMKHLCDELYPDAAVIRVVLDNLNTHALRVAVRHLPAGRGVAAAADGWSSTTPRSTPRG